MLTGCSGTLVRDSQHGLLRLPLALVTLFLDINPTHSISGLVILRNCRAADCLKPRSVVHRRNPRLCGAHPLTHLHLRKRRASVGLLLVLWGLRCGPVLRTRMLQRRGVALGSADTLRLSSVPLPRLARLGMVGSLSDVRRSIQITMMCDAARAAHRTTVVAHVQVRLTHMTLPGRIRRIDLEDPTAVGLNHVTGPPVHLATEPTS